jgi:hypothetical protein
MRFLTIILVLAVAALTVTPCTVADSCRSRKPLISCEPALGPERPPNTVLG